MVIYNDELLNSKVQKKITTSRRFIFMEKLAKIVESFSKFYHYIKNVWRLLDRFGFIYQAWQKGKQKVENYFYVNESADRAIYEAGKRGVLIDSSTMSKKEIDYLLSYFGVDVGKKAIWPVT